MFYCCEKGVNPCADGIYKHDAIVWLFDVVKRSTRDRFEDGVGKIII